MSEPQPAITVEQFREAAARIEAQVSKVIVGQKAVVRHVLIGLIAGGHMLLEGVPGLGKTMLVRTLADALELQFSRIQFTPDLMPADIVGTDILQEDEQGKRTFRFQPGPVFANLVLADEINRATPKTQSALLEAMQERSVTVGSETHILDKPFFVMATQNPIEQEGTYPLPEAQLDRLMFNIFVDYPSQVEEEQILAATTGGQTPDMATVFTARQILNMQKLVAGIPISEYVIKYVTALVRATRPVDPSAPDFVKQMVD